MNKADKRQLKRFIFALYITPLVKLNLIYQAYKWFYLNKYLGISSELQDHIPNEVDRLIVEPYLSAIKNTNKTDYLIIYSAVCRTLYKRTLTA